MSRKRDQRRKGIAGLDLLEEATHLLRLAPASTLLAYFTGAAPFLLGLLYYWADMSRGAFADRRAAGGALLLALLFVWMRTWQTVFMVRLRAQLAGRADAPWTPRRFARAALVNAALQPSALLVLPVSLVLTLPAPWALAFYQNAVALADDHGGGIRDTARHAWRLARLWFEQGINALLIAKLFALVVFLNVMLALAVLPQLVKMLLGIESLFTLSPWALLNTTLLLAAAALTYLVVDPLLRAAYTLRCHYGNAITTGDDLLAELRALPGRAPAPVAVLLLACAVVSGLGVNSVVAAETPAPPPQANVKQLDRAVEDVLDRTEFNWRLPRERAPVVEGDSWFDQQIDAVSVMIRDFFKWIGEMMRKFSDWWERTFGRHGGGGTVDAAPSFSWLALFESLLWVIVAVLLGVILYFIFKAWRQGRGARVIEAAPVSAMPDLADESVGADQLPEDGWLQLAREQMARGDLRLAMRALYLACLAHLAQRELVKLEKFKSNRDYEREVLRRARAVPDLQRAFSENVGAFDRAWYGLYEVSRDGLSAFERNVERIRSC